MASDVFWSNPENKTPAQSLLTVDSLGDQQVGPVGFIPGTAAGAVPAEYSIAAKRVYPWNFDYSDTKRQEAYAALKQYKLAEFSSWHSLYQARYILETGPVTIPGPTAGSVPSAHYILLNPSSGDPDRRTVLNVATLTLSDYQQLSAADRALVDGDSVFQSFVAKSIGLVSKFTPDSSGRTVGQTYQDAVNSINAASNMPPDDRKVFTDQLDLIKARLDQATLIVPGNYSKEIGAILSRFQRASAFVGWNTETPLVTSFTSTDERILTARFENDVKGNVFSSDSGETVRKGYTEMMRAERQVLTAQLRREAIARIPTAFDPKQDTAQLIYQLQMMYQAETDARGDANTEEMAQLNRLLSDYAIMQRLVNETLKSFNPKKSDEVRRFLNIGGTNDGGVNTEQKAPDDQNFQISYWFTNGPEKIVPAPGVDNVDQRSFDEGPRFHWYLLAGTEGNARVTDPNIYEYNPKNDTTSVWGTIYTKLADNQPNSTIVRSGGLTPEEMRVVAMFSNDFWGSGQQFQLHPLEKLYAGPNGGRPRQTLSDETTKGKGSLTLQRRDYWDKWSTQLSDAVTILNQKNQLKQNEIDNDSKQSNRYFDLGSNALRKMNEMLMAIGRM